MSWTNSATLIAVTVGFLSTSWVHKSQAAVNRSHALNLATMHEDIKLIVSQNEELQLQIAKLSRNQVEHKQHEDAAPTTRTRNGPQ